MENSKNYSKESPRITAQYFNSETDELLFEIKNRSWMDIGELFSDNNLNVIIKNELKNKILPENVMLIAIADNIKLK